MATEEVPVDLRRESARGTMWASVSFFSAKGATFAATIVLARILVPEDFGQVALALLAIQYLEVVNELGLGSALISRDPRATRAPDTAFILGVALSVLMLAASWLAAPLIADFFDEPEITDLFRVLALVLPVQGLALVPKALLERDLRFQGLAVPEVARALLKGSVSIGLALAGYGAWGLIWGQVAGEIISTVLMWALCRWRPRFDFDRTEAAWLTRFGSYIVGIGLIGALLMNVDYVVIGRSLSVAELGLYTLAFRVPELAIQSISRIVTRVAHPVLSKALVDGEDHRQIFLGYLKWLTLASFPVGVGVAVISPVFTETVYGSAWSRSGPLMAAISVAMTISSLAWMSGALYKATNRPEILQRIALARVVPTVGLIMLAVRWGIIGVALAHIAIACVTVIGELLVARRVIGIELSAVGRAIRPAVISTGVMALVLFGMTTVFDPRGVPGLVLIPLVGALVYGASLRALDPRILSQVSALRPGAC